MRDLIYKPITISIATIVTIVIIFSLWQNTKEIANSSKSIKILEDQVTQKQEKIDQMKDQLQQADSDFTKEQIVRNELLLQKEGEHIIQIVDENPDLSIENQPEFANISPWQAWKKLLLKN